MEVAELLKEAQEPEEVQIAGLLHDVLEDCDVEYSTLALMFGPRVADLVAQVTKPSFQHEPTLSRSKREWKILQHLQKADSQGQSIKLADIISNTSTISDRDPAFARQYMLEKSNQLGVLTDGNDSLFQQAQTIVMDFLTNKRPLENGGEE
jgi:(p)ppGpp synthase/HD superfamily hydrolase